MDDLTTASSIIKYFENAVTHKEVIPPHLWMEGAMRLNVLMGAEDARLFEIEQALSRLELAYLDNDERHNVSAARSRVKVEEVYKAYNIQKSNIKRYEEFIRIAKLHARLANEEIKNY